MKLVTECPLFVLCFRACAQAQEIERVSSGVVVTATEPVYTINGYATVYTALHVTDDKSWTRSWTSVLTKCIQRITTVVNHPDLLAVKGNILHGLRARQAQLPRYRTRRAPLGFIGDIGSTLFGLATADDVQAVADATEQVGRAVTGIAESQNKIIAQVNQLGHLQETISVKLSETVGVVNSLSKIVRALANATQDLAGQTAQLTFIQQIQEIAGEMDIQLTLRLYLESRQRELRLGCESRLVTESLVPISIVNGLLTDRRNRIDLDAYNYYQYATVTKLIEINDILYCVIRTPLLEYDQYRTYHLNTFPVCTDQGCYRTYRDETFIMDTRGGSIYFPEVCYGVNAPLACQPGVRYAPDQQPCLQGLISNNPVQQKQCPITYTKTPGPPYPLQTTIPNRYVLRTDAVLYQYRCSDQRPQSAKLEAGTYIITIPPECDLDAGHWLLHGLKLTTIRINSTQPTLPQPLNITTLGFATQPSWKHPPFPAGINQLDFPTYEDLEKIAIPDSVDLLSPLDHLRSPYKLTILILLCLVLIPLVILLGLRWYTGKWCTRPVSPSKAENPEPLLHYNARAQALTYPTAPPPVSSGTGMQQRYWAATQTEGLYPILPRDDQDTTGQDNIALQQEG